MIDVQMDIETAEHIFCVVLEQQYLGLSTDIGKCPVFSMDKEENQREFDKLREAFKLVADYNGVRL